MGGSAKEARDAYQSFMAAYLPDAAGKNKSLVFFTEDISGNGLLKIYSRISQRPPAKPEACKC